MGCPGHRSHPRLAQPSSQTWLQPPSPQRPLQGLGAVWEALGQEATARGPPVPPAGKSLV